MNKSKVVKMREEGLDGDVPGIDTPAPQTWRTSYLEQEQSRDLRQVIANGQIAKIHYLAHAKLPSIKQIRI
jgi:hypothetical protein